MMSTSETTMIKKTPFYERHIAASAKMVEFAGYMMPVQYDSIINEHRAVRESVGLFDLSHMGEFELSGKDSLSFLEKVTTNRVSSLSKDDIQYSCMTYPDGGIVDDLLVYNLGDHYLLVVNASNIEKDFDWLTSHLEGSVSLINRSDDFGLLAIQGPQSQKVMTKLTEIDLNVMKYYTSQKGSVAGVDLLFSRTGYTGEDGFELYIENKDCDKLWEAVCKAGQEQDIKLIGLGARDTLRLEMRMALYGSDMDQTTSPIEAGLGWIVDLDKEFIGRELISKQKKEKPSRRLVCLELEGRVFPRSGYEIFDGTESVGKITSGTFSPSLEVPIAMGYVPRRLSKTGTELSVAVRNKSFGAKVIKPPFYKNASHK